MRKTQTLQSLPHPWPPWAWLWLSKPMGSHFGQNMSRVTFRQRPLGRPLGKELCRPLGKDLWIGSQHRGKWPLEEFFSRYPQALVGGRVLPPLQQVAGDQVGRTAHHGHPESTEGTPYNGLHGTPEWFCKTRRNKRYGCGCQNPDGIPFWAGAPPILVYCSWDWDVHWGCGILTHGHMVITVSQHSGVSAFKPCVSRFGWRDSSQRFDEGCLVGHVCPGIRERRELGFPGCSMGALELYEVDP